MSIPDFTTTLQTSLNHGSSLAKSQTPSSIYLLGYPIQHSLAPPLHNTLFKRKTVPWEYKLLESTDPQALVTRLREENCIGAAVTMPHKIAFTSLVDELTDAATVVGAINTVFVRLDGAGRRRYIGTNTDVIGIREALMQNTSPEKVEANRTRPGLVVGGGGACRSAIYTLHYILHVNEIYIINRLEDEAKQMIASFTAIPSFKANLIFIDSVEKASALPAPFFVVGTVPDIPPKTAPEHLARECIKTLMSKAEKGVVLEMCYHPKIQTWFSDFAESAGWKVVYGPEAMIWQGVAQNVLWREDAQLSVGDIEAVKRVVSDGIAKSAHL